MKEKHGEAYGSQFPTGEIVKQRIVWIDVCRVLFMFIVVFGHSTDILPHEPNMGAMRILNMPFYPYSYPCGIVLMFYFFSGMLNKSSARWLDWKKFFLFMIPTILWNFICMLINRVFPETFIGWLGALGILPSYRAVIPTVVLPCDYPLWFMTFLAYYSLVFPMLKRMPMWAQTLAVATSFTCSCIYANAVPQDGIPYYILRESQSIGIFVLGLFVAQLGIGRLTEKLDKYAWLMVVMLLPYSFFHFIPMNTKLLANGFSAIVGVVALCSYGVVFSKCFPRFSARIVRWAPAVFFIYVFHVPFFFLMKQFVNLPAIPVYAFYAYALLCYVVSIFVFTYVKTNVKWIDRYIFMHK